MDIEEYSFLYASLKFGYIQNIYKHLAYFLA